uniref:Putative chain length factor n=1 Tax=Amycolatopsis sp. SANK 60206 TaxID=1642649 RepID=A0A0E3Z8W6_9PSEU|nr:putative chain length factor [Amycolatopsis sp. SANK 60206]
MPSALMSHRTIVEAVCLTPWGDAASGLPGAACKELPPVAGFAISRFGPLVHAVASACLEPVGGAGNHVGPDGARTAIVLATVFGDVTTVDTANRAVAADQRPDPVLFFQSVTTSILSHLTRQYGIEGPLISISAVPDPASNALLLADSLLDDHELHQVLVIGVETEPNERMRRTSDLAAADGWSVPLPVGDAAAALLLRRVGTQTRRARLTLAEPVRRAVDDSDESAGPLGWLGRLMKLCADVGSGQSGACIYELSL